MSKFEKASLESRVIASQIAVLNAKPAKISFQRTARKVRPIFLVALVLTILACMASLAR